MKIIIDVQNTPKSLQAICEEYPYPVYTIRTRDKDLYKLSSKDFDQEKKMLSDQANLVLKEAGTGDILITKDLELARKMIDQVYVVLHPNGFIYNPKSIMALSYDAYIAEQNQTGQENSPTPLKNRYERLDQQFRETLSKFMKKI